MKSLIFLGTNSVLERHIEACERQQQPIAGIIDSDWFGNRESFAGLPILDSQTIFEIDPLKYCDYVFFVGTNFHPDSGRDIAKRQMFISLIEKYQLHCINLIDPSSQVGGYVKLGQGIFIGANTVIEPGAEIQDFVTIWGLNTIGHNSVIGKNSVIQRGASVEAVTSNNVYVGMNTWVFRGNDPLTVGANAKIDPCLHVCRDVDAEEHVRLDRNSVRIYRSQNPSK
jgi:carbonic anhydrase/acetyltransferase-like protein (isoleucine patch superfamily)